MQLCSGLCVIFLQEVVQIRIIYFYIQFDSGMLLSLLWTRQSTHLGLSHLSRMQLTCVGQNGMAAHTHA